MLEAASRKNCGSVKDTPDGSRSVRLRFCQLCSRSAACASRLKNITNEIRV